MRRWQLGLLVVAALLLASCLGGPTSTNALTYGSGKYGSCQYGTCSISLGTSGNVALNVTPTFGGRCTVQSDNVSVLTDDSNGYTLTLSSSTNTTALTHSSDQISTASGSLTSPGALAPNAWGYRVDGSGGFGSGPTTSLSSAAPPSWLFAGLVPFSGTAAQIVSTSAPADPAQITHVWYGVCANASIPAGTYTGSVLYTAVTN